MTCLCGDTDCPSCGTAQGTHRGPPYDYHQVIPLGLDPGGNEVALEVVLKTYGDEKTKLFTTEMEPHRGPWTRACFVALTKGEVEVLGKPTNQDAAAWVAWIRETVDTWPNLLVSREWRDAMLQFWERWHLNDLKPGTEAQMEAVGRFEPDPNTEATLEEVRAHLEAEGLLVDRGCEFGAAVFGYGPGFLVRVLDKTTADAIIDLAEEGLDQTHGRRT